MPVVEKARTLIRGDRDGLSGLIRTLSDTLTARGRKSFRRAVAEAVEGDLSMGWGNVHIRIDDFFSIYEEAFRRAGRAESSVIGQLELDTNHPRVVRYLRDRSSTLVTNIDESTRAALQRSVSRGAADGLQPEEMVNRIKRIVGLTERDAVALSNFERGLKRQGISPNVIARRAKEYERRLKEQRALVIARTEMTDAIETARQEAWEQAVRAGIVARNAIWRTWQKRDDEACVMCTALHEGKARLGGVFRRGGYEAKRPPAHPNCRCTVKYTADLRVLRKRGMGRSDKWWDVYHALRRKGMSKEQAAKIAYSRIEKHGKGSHDDKDHGNWARGKRKLYHGTRYHAEQIEMDERLRPSEAGEIGPGVYLTPDRATAERFAALIDETGKVIGHGEIYEFEFDLDSLKILDLTRDMTVFREAENVAYERGGRYLVSEVLSEMGYDGAVHYSPGDKFPEYVIFDRIDLQKHAGPGPHPGTGTPQTVHGGQFSKPKIYVGADEIIEGGHVRAYPLGIMGEEFISPNDERIGDEVYHVTTNLSSVNRTGIIKAGLHDIGLGGSSKDEMMVSLTVSKTVAEGIERDLNMVARFYEKFGLNPLDKLSPAYERDMGIEREGNFFDRDKEQVKAYNREAIKFLEAEAKKQGWVWDSQYRYQHDFTLDGDGSTTMFNDFFSRRSSWAQDKFNQWPVPEQYRNPLLFSTPWAMARIKPENVGIVTVPRKALKTGAALMDFDIGNGALEEISFFGDIVIETGITKHYGPGDHPSGTSQKVHGHGTYGQPKFDALQDNPGEIIGELLEDRPDVLLEEAIQSWKGDPHWVRSGWKQLIDGEEIEPGSHRDTFIVYNYRNQARVMFDAVLNAPPTEHKLYRGAKVTGRGEDKLTPGDVVDMAYVGFSASHGTAYKFARHHSRGRTSLLWELPPGVRALDLDRGRGEEEFVIHGQFKVAEVDRSYMEDWNHLVIRLEQA